MSNKKISALTSASTPLAGTEVLPIVQSSSTVKVAVSDLTAGRTVAMAALGVGTAATGTRLVNIASTAGVAPLVAVGPNGYLLIDNTGGGANIYSANVSHTFEGVSGGNILTMSSTTKDIGMTSGNFAPQTAAKGINFTANTPASGMTSQLLNWYEEGTWTPNITNLTVVGTPATTGTYTRIGRLVYIECRFSASSIASTGGVSYVSGLPFTAGFVSACIAINASTSVSLGNGQINGTILYTPTFGATAGTVSISGSYEV